MTQDWEQRRLQFNMAGEKRELLLHGEDGELMYKDLEIFQAEHKRTTVEVIRCGLRMALAIEGLTGLSPLAYNSILWGLVGSIVNPNPSYAKNYEAWLDRRIPALVAPLEDEAILWEKLEALTQTLHCGKADILRAGIALIMGSWAILNIDPCSPESLQGIVRETVRRLMAPSPGERKWVTPRMKERLRAEALARQAYLNGKEAQSGAGN